MRLNKDESFEN